MKPYSCPQREPELLGVLRKSPRAACGPTDLVMCRLQVHEVIVNHSEAKSEGNNNDFDWPVGSYGNMVPPKCCPMLKSRGNSEFAAWRTWRDTVARLTLLSNRGSRDAASRDNQFPRLPHFWTTSPRMEISRRSFPFAVSLGDTCHF